MTHDDAGLAVVTGGAGGIGRAIALRLARDGFAIGVLDRDRAGAETTCEAVAKAGGHAAAATADINEELQVMRAFADLKARLGPVPPSTEVLVGEADVAGVDLIVAPR